MKCAKITTKLCLFQSIDSSKMKTIQSLGDVAEIMYPQLLYVSW